MEWHDLTHPIDEDLVRLDFLPAPRTEPIDEALLAATELTMATHAGTHVEAPRHRFPDGDGIDAFPPDRFLGEGLVWEPGVGAEEPIAHGAVATLDDRLEPGDALLVRTGWAEFAGTDRYTKHPYLTADAAAWLVDAGVGWVGFDSPTPEKPADLQDPDDGFEYPVHTELLGNDVLIAENLTGLGPLAGERVEVAASPLPVVGCDAAPARIAARPVR